MTHFAGQRLGDSAATTAGHSDHFEMRQRRAGRLASLSVESSRGCSDRQTRRSAVRASTEVREGAMCVQRLDDSLNSAIRTTYRSSLRSSSKHEPRGPPLEVVCHFTTLTPRFFNNSKLKKQSAVYNKAAELGRATATTTAEGGGRYTSSSTADTLIRCTRLRGREHFDKVCSRSI